MFRLRTPSWVKRHLTDYPSLDSVPDDVFGKIRQKMKKFSPENPIVSIVIIAYNEEEDLLDTLSSLADTLSYFSTEILVVNNNSTDRTQEILDRCGVRSIVEKRQGIGWARQAGLEAAKGEIIINGDADSIYPPQWSEAMAEILTNDPFTSTVYTRYSFIPSGEASRLPLSIHEVFSSTLFRLRRLYADPVNVMGFSFGFRKTDAMEVGGFEVEGEHRWEDGLMVLALTDKGRISLVRSNRARVWTSDRRLIIDGGYRQAFVQRAKKHLGYMPDYLNLKSSIK